MGFARRQRAKTKPLHDPRPEILDHHIGRGDQVARDRKIIGAFKVQHDAALATLQYGIGGMPPAGPARRVDANDLGALIGQQQCRQRSSEILAEIDDADAVQRAGHLTTPRSRA
jgi:hypothetical protein